MLDNKSKAELDAKVVQLKSFFFLRSYSRSKARGSKYSNDLRRGIVLKIHSLRRDQESFVKEALQSWASQEQIDSAIARLVEIASTYSEMLLDDSMPVIRLLSKYSEYKVLIEKEAKAIVNGDVLT